MKKTAKLLAVLAAGAVMPIGMLCVSAAETQTYEDIYGDAVFSG